MQVSVPYIQTCAPMVPQSRSEPYRTTCRVCYHSDNVIIRLRCPTHEPIHKITHHSRAGGHPNTHKHLASTGASGGSQQQPHTVIIGHSESSNAVLSIATPKVRSIQWCTKGPKERYLHRYCAHVEFATQHVGLGIQLPPLSIDVLVI